MPEPSARRRELARLLGSRSGFRPLLASFAVSNAGDGFRTLAVNVWLFEATDGSVLQRLLLVLLANVPGILVGGIAGVVADRWDRYAILVGADVIRIITGLGLAACAAAPAPVPALVVVAVGNAVGVFSATSSFALLPRLVTSEDLPRANGVLETTQWATQLIGPAIAAVTLASAGPVVAFLVDAGSFALSALLLLQLRARMRTASAAGRPADPDAESRHTDPREQRESAWASARAGLRLVRADRQLRAFLGASYGVAFLTACTSFALIYLVADSLHLPASALGFLYSLNGGIAVLAAVLTTGFIAARRTGQVMAVGMAGLCGAQVVMGLAPDVVVLALGVVISATANAPYNVAVTSLFQSSVPADHLGRIAGLDTVVDNLASVAGYLVSMLVISIADARAVFVVSALVALPFLVLALRRVSPMDAGAARAPA